MSEQSPRDRELDALVYRDGELTRAWRAASGDEPPPALDDAIRAAARRAVQAGPGRLPFGVRWRVPLSIAAVLMLSATLTLLVADRREHVPTAGVSEAPVPATEPAADAGAAPAPSQSKRLTRAPGVPAGESSTPRAGTAAPPASAERKREAEARELAKGHAGDEVSVPPPPPRQRSDARHTAEELSAGPIPESRQEANFEAQPLRDTAPVERSFPAAPQPAVPTPAPDEEAAPASPESLASRPSTASPEAFPAQSATGAEARAYSESDAAQPREAQSPPSRAAMKVQDAAPFDARTWVERILVLRRQGKLKEAQQSLEAFRRRYPDYPLPPELAPAAPAAR